MKIAKLEQWFSLACCVLMMTAVAIQKEGKIFGHQLGGEPEKETVAAVADTVPTLRTSGDTLIVNTAYIGRDIEGYAGQVPMELSVKDGRVVKVEAMDNSETPSFFEEAIGGLAKQWDGMTVAEALEKQVDAVSGATYSSNAIIGNVRLALTEASSDSSSPSSFVAISPSTIAGLVVALMAAILPLFVRSKRYRMVQLILNVVVLGFWCGAFVNYTLLIRLMASGLNVWLYLVPIVMLATAFVYPLFGKKQYYCSNVCPLGSLQQLAAKCPTPKLRLGTTTVKVLDWFRQILWSLLMLSMWTAVWFDWIDYELFAAFLFQSAPALLLVVAGAFMLLSLFVNRPYCRFVCPTGTLLKISEMGK